MIVLIFTFFACLTFSLLNRKHGRSHGRQTEERWKEGTRFGGGCEGGGGAVLPNWDNRRRAGGVSGGNVLQLLVCFSRSLEWLLVV